MKGRRSREGDIEGGEAGNKVDTGDQLATKDPVDLDSGIDYGVLKCVVRSTPATERDQVMASWVRPLVGSWKGIPKYGLV
ncbi:hypothetical protein Scep_004314 [Stephania cephalantha]|uniref:Uncharacterized protein n=1 Tax=Stephania cephalantha TaxID=152367 RepID=A0AAP0KUS9_9MAGN